MKKIVFVQHVRTKAATSHLFTPLFMFIHLPLIHFAPLPRLLIDFKNSKRLTYFSILLCIIMHLLLFLSPAWLAYFLSQDYFSYINSLSVFFSVSVFCFLFLSDEGPTLETLDLRLSAVSAVKPTVLYFYLYLYISAAYEAHYVYTIVLSDTIKVIFIIKPSRVLSWRSHLICTISYSCIFICYSHPQAKDLKLSKPQRQTDDLILSETNFLGLIYVVLKYCNFATPKLTA